MELTTCLIVLIVWEMSSVINLKTTVWAMKSSEIALQEVETTSLGKNNNITSDITSDNKSLANGNIELSQSNSNNGIKLKEEISFYNVSDKITEFNSYFNVEVLMVLESFRSKKPDNIFIAQMVPKESKIIFEKKFKILKNKIKALTNNNKEVSSDNIVLNDNTSTMKQMMEYLDCLIEDFSKNEITPEEVQKLVDEFINNNFNFPDYYLKPAEIDINPEEITLDKKIDNDEVKEMVSALLERWKDLYKQISFTRSDYFTLIQIQHPFMVPGGMFREYYYWDSYWILDGLLISKCYNMAENIVRNFIYILKNYGYIPNGTRKYFLHRTQPPYFVSMLKKLYDFDKERFGDLVLNEGLEAAEIEYKFWDKERTSEVLKNDKSYKATFYRVITNFPRPESYSHDFHLYNEKFKGDNDIKNERELFSNIKSGCESGWDFSTRWLKDDSDLGSLDILHQIPVDLNSVLFYNEKTMAFFFKEKGAEFKNKINFYEEAAKNREIMINELLWNEEVGCWNDYNIKEQKFIDKRFYFSNITPLIYGIKKNLYKILKLYQKELFGYIGGIPVSGKFDKSIHQWDYPNCWPPHQEMLVTYLSSMKEDELAIHIARRFFKSALLAFKKEHSFFEKYKCNEEGKAGGGGEYVIQLGFGWTNGILLRFIQEYGDNLNENENPTEEEISKYLDEKINTYE